MGSTFPNSFPKWEERRRRCTRGQSVDAWQTSNNLSRLYVSRTPRTPLVHAYELTHIRTYKGYIPIVILLIRS